MKRKPDDTEALMQTMNSKALEVAKIFKIDLDYSDASIEQVEKILGKVHKGYKKSKDDEGLRGVALFFAAYIGEVIRKKGFGGTWERHHPEIGDDTFPFHWREGVLFLYGWCQKRIFDGKQDDVWFKYRCTVLNNLKKKPRRE